MLSSTVDWGKTNGDGTQAEGQNFISYSRRDMAFVDNLDEALKARGFEPLIDRAEIYAFEDWWKRLQALIAQADTVVFVLSPDAVASREALKEVEYAASLNKRFAPIVCRHVDDSTTPEALRRLNFVFFDDPAKFEESAERLAEALRTDIDWVRHHTEYGESAHHWTAAGRPNGLLLRSPALEEAERWIATRPRDAPAPTEETQAFVSESRRGATRRRNILSGSLAAGLIVALALAGLAYWQRGIAVEQQRIASEQRQRAESTLAAATATANKLVFDLAQRFRNSIGIPATLVKNILERARALQDELTRSGQVTPDLNFSKAAALTEIAQSLLAIGDTAGALSAARQAREIDAALVAGDHNEPNWQRALAVATEDVGDVQVALGDLAAALKFYQDDLTIALRLARAVPGSDLLQRGVGTAYSKIGNVQMEQGQPAAALNSYRDGLAIDLKLAQSKSKDVEALSDLAVSYGKVGDAQVALGHLADAFKSYQDSLAVRERIAQANTNDGYAQRQLSIAHQRIGDVQVAQGNLASALTSFERAIAVLAALAQSDLSNSGWQRDLGVMYS